ncbi:MAG: universal stress protein [Ignavibacteriae bacterium]|nr:universal stress protein [Ignavibacteriota bacterium]
MKTPKKILIPTDLSRFSLEAVMFGQEFAELFDAELTLVYVDDVHNRMEVMVGALAADQGSEMSRRRELIERIQHLLLNNNLTRHSVRIEVRFGSPAHEIVHTAGEIHADLIVMSTHGRTGLRHVLLGSVAEKVVRYARCPVLTLKPEEIREYIPITEDDIACSLHFTGAREETHS